MQSANTTERRKRARGKSQATQEALLWIEKRDGSWQKVPVQVQDSAEHGLGILLGELLREGMAVLVEGAGVAGPGGGRARGRVAWCRQVSAGVFRCGIALEGSRNESKPVNDDFDDHYETLEVNPVASPDTIHKIYRALAQRLHPDNPESGNEEQFKRLVTAYRVLSDPERRAAFDVERSRSLSNRWRIFDPESAAPGLEQEQRKRRAILAVLYAKRMRQPENCGVGIVDLEQLLGVPREHLEFPLWFLREQGWLQRVDNGKHLITAKGVDHAETTGAWQPQTAQDSRLLSTAPAP